MPNQRPVLVTGATGYVGGRLVPLLLERGHRVRAMGRSLSKLSCRPWAQRPNLELVKADVMDLESLGRAAKGCRAAYYLVHSMNPATKDFAAADRQAALSMRAACEWAGLERIIYLGGLVPQGQKASHHLASRAEVGRILQAGAVPTTFLRAAMILGSGSASFEIMRYLVERLPVMTTPHWVRSRVQPISIRNVLGYLAGCLEAPRTSGGTFDICGPDVLTYQDLFSIYAREAGLAKRLVIPLPLLSPRLSAMWIHLVTPVHASLARPLAEGLSNSVVCTDNRIRGLIPQELLGCRAAIRRILEKRALHLVETDWTDAGQVRPPEWLTTGDAPYAGGDIRRSGHQVLIQAEPQEVWDAVKSIGGQKGYHFGNWLWRLRGQMDKLFGGVSLARGRRHPSRIAPGDALDYWRVLEADPPHRLLLLSEMVMPGEAVLEFLITPSGGAVELQMVAHFMPRGLLGVLYWIMVRPLHDYVFGGMLRNLALHMNRPILVPPAPFDPGPPQACRWR